MTKAQQSKSEANATHASKASPSHQGTGDHRTRSKPAKFDIPDSIFRKVFESGPADYLLLTPTFQIVAASNSFLVKQGRSWEEIAGQVAFDAFPGNSRYTVVTGECNWRDSMKEVLATRTMQTMPLRRYRVDPSNKDGVVETRVCVPSNTPILDRAGEIQFILHRLMDVTEIVNSRNSQEDWEEVVRSLQGQVVEMEAERSLQSAKATKLAKEATVLAKEKIDDRATSSAKDFEMQERANAMDAELAREEAKAIILAKQKITDRATTNAREHRLQEEAELKFMGLLEMAPDPMVIIDQSGTIILVNAQGEALFGYERQELLGETVDILLPFGYILENAENAAKFFASSQNQMVGVVTELQGRRKDLTDFPFDVTVRPLHSSDGMLSILAIRDLTERRKVNSQIIRAQRLESIGTFAGNIAHDLNNALAPVLMALELLRKQNPSAAVLVNTIESGANLGAEMLRQLLVFSKGSYVEPQLVESRAIVAEIEGLIQSTFPDSIEVKISVAEDLSSVLGDPTQIHQILLNLCVNARDAMPAGGVLSILAENVEIDSSYASALSGAVPGSYVMWRISDSGVGIPPEILDHIFEPFFTTKSLGKGTGLGLSIVTGIVKSHHGFINAYSTPMKGSTFAVYIPAYVSQAESSWVPPVTPSLFRGKGEMILVVDDSAGMRETTSSVLDSVNLHVITANDGMDALSIVKKHGHRLSAIITDMHMPNMDGLAFVGELRALLPNVGIIVISGNLDEEEARVFSDLGVQTFLDKPFTQNKLVSALSRVLAV